MGVEVLQKKIAGSHLSGVSVKANNTGAVIHPEAEEKDIEIIADVLGVKIERIILTMQEQNIISEIQQPRISVLYINDDMQKVAHSITSLLRLNKIPTDIDLAGRNLKKQMDIANTAGFTIIVGPQELEQGNVVLKDMRTGTEGTVSLEKLTDDPKSIFNLEMP
jgi:histidyl-tRNA synthetase